MNILIASSIDPAAIEALREAHDVVCAFNADERELQDRIADRDILVFRSGVTISAAVLSRAPSLKVLIRAGSGVDNIDMDYVENSDLVIHRIPEPGAKAVAELSFGMMIGLARKMCQADQLVRRGRWAKRETTGYLLTGKTLGIVGAGSIGSRTGHMGASWGMEVVGCCKTFLPEGKRERLASLGVRLTDFDEVITSADFVSIHVPLTELTRNMFDASAFSRMKPGAFLVNLARGGVVNEADLYDALTRTKQLRGAALDVHEREGECVISPLAELPNVILTPHIGAQTFDSQKEIGERIVSIVQASSRSPDDR